ncbi:MAG: branched-chain amino acid ABC transporter permease [Rhodobacteraceae bacterium]|nr:branched-chain amino acid ABC transporter permease [Paracoccaceae bacterium]
MRRSDLLTLTLLALLAVLPPVFFCTGHPFYLDLATRLVILAIAATSLNLVLGYGGMVSFGHAAYIGIGAYAVGIPVYHDLWGGAAWLASTSGWVHLALAMGLSALFALGTGAISLRTRGVHFIMITMAFAQMVYYLFVSLGTYGGDDGLVIEHRSRLPGISLDNPLQLYGLCLAVLVATIVIVRTIMRSRFGQVIKGARGNEERMATLGYNTYAYRLTAFVIAGAIAGLSGFLMGNFTAFISPEMMAWTRSGELMFMVILGGTATTPGPLLGTLIFIVTEELLSHYTRHWQLPFGLMLIGVVLFMRGGLTGAFRRRE